MIPLIEAYRESKEELKRLVMNMKLQGRTNITIEELRVEMDKKGIYISPYELEFLGYALILQKLSAD
jgi:hypothetical protein